MIPKRTTSLKCVGRSGLGLTLALLSGIAWGLDDTGGPRPSAEAAPTSATTETEAESKDVVNPTELTERWGVQILPIRRAAAGHMLDFRYRVVDAAKAAPLFVRQTKPYLIHQRSGKVLGVPETAKLGPLRNSNKPQAGRIYWMFFDNPGGLVKTGDKVTVKIGDFQAADLIIE